MTSRATVNARESARRARERETQAFERAYEGSEMSGVKFGRCECGLRIFVVICGESVVWNSAREFCWEFV